MSNFQSILSRKATEIEKPVPAPVGHYLAVNPKMPEFKNIGKNETPAAEFTFNLLQPGDDIDQDEFADWGGVEKLKGKTVRMLAWLSDDAQYRTKQMLVDAFGVEEDGKTLAEMFSETVGVQLMVEISHRPSQDGSELYMEVKSVASA